MSNPCQFCTFFLDKLFFGVEVEKVQEVIRYQDMTRVPLASPILRGLMNLRGQIVPVVDLRRRLHMSDRPAGEPPINVIVRTGDGPVSLLVDQIGDVLEVRERQYERPPRTLVGAARDLIRGTYKLEDRLLLVLDTEMSVNLAGENLVRN